MKQVNILWPVRSPAFKAVEEAVTNGLLWRTASRLGENELTSHKQAIVDQLEQETEALLIETS